MGNASVLVKLADATSSLEITDAGLGAAFLKDYTAAIGRPGLVTLESTQALPPIGDTSSGQGGVYAGLCRGMGGKPDYHLFVHADEKDSINWQAAIDWAKTLEVDGHKDFTLPTRREQSVLFGNVPELFQKEWYWSCEAHAATAYSAWSQSFDTGDQYYYLKDYDTRARAVRRIIIAPLPSPLP